MFMQTCVAGKNMLLFFKKKNSFVKSWKSFGFSGGFVKTNNIFKVDGRFYYGWIMLICGFLSMFICYVIKVNCSPLFITPICKEFGINRTMYAQVNTCLTVAMMISSLFIGKVYKKIPVKFALTGCVAIAALCYVGMSFSHNIVQLYILAIIHEPRNTATVRTYFKRMFTIIYFFKKLFYFWIIGRQHVFLRTLSGRFME